MNLNEWLSLSDTARVAERDSWDVYKEGYWHTLNEEVIARFRSEFASAPHIRLITGGVYHDGEFIVGVSTDLPYPQVIELPEEYLGFRVFQFCGGTPPPTATEL